jgi:hypothetical protein
MAADSVFQKELHNGITNFTVLQVTIHHSTPCMTDSLYTFKCKSFRKTRHTLTFGMTL